MKVCELIEMLNGCPQDANVLLAYDSLVCIRDCERESSFILDAGTQYEEAGVYLCAMGPESVEYHRDDIGGKPIPDIREKEKQA